MKKKFRFLLLPGMVALSFLYYAFDPSPASFVLTQQSSMANYPIKVDFGTGLPTLTQMPGKAVPYWKVFFSLGDGRFWMGTLAELQSKQYFYYDPSKLPANSSKRNSFVEYMAAYDDNINPQRSALVQPQISVGTIPTGEELKVPMGQNEAVKLQSTCNPSCGDILTFIITRQVPNTQNQLINYTRATAIFKYDIKKLTYQGIEDYDNLMSPPTFNVILDHFGMGNDTGVVEVKFNSLNALSPFSQQNIFLNFRTLSTAKEGDSYIVPSVILKSPGAGGELTFVDSDEMLNQKIVDTHDPNHKFAPGTINTNWQFVEFNIEFQNEGSSETDKIWVEDKLDLLLDYDYSPTITAYWGCTQTPVPNKLNTTERSYKIDFGNLKLKGLKQSGIGTAFPEEATKAGATIRFKVRDLNDWLSSAMLNQARVKFDCNPFYNTNISYSRIPCSDSTAVLKDTTFTAASLSDVPTILTYIDNNYLTPNGYSLTNGKYRWYPSTEVSNPQIAKPQFLANAKGEYTLVASKCDRLYYGGKINDLMYVHIKIASPLKITVDKCIKPGFLVATVSGYTGSSPKTHLKWNMCDSLGTSIIIPVVSSKPYYYFGVTDLSTGNETELFYKPTNKICNTTFLDYIKQNVKLITAVFALILIGFVFYLFGKKK